MSDDQMAKKKRRGFVTRIDPRKGKDAAGCPPTDIPTA